MGFFTTRERDALGKSPEMRAPRKVRPPVPQDFAPRRRPAENDFTGHVHALMQRVTDSSLKQIDDLIGDLCRRREELLSETARVQREILAYAKLNQTTMQSNKIITESLASLNKVLEAPTNGADHEPDVADEPEPSGEDEAFAQEDGQDHASFGDQSEKFGDQAEKFGVQVEK
jgi:hypothetical protein